LAITFSLTQVTDNSTRGSCNKVTRRMQAP